jgi:predicted PurR-regulated permease PerM
MTETERLRSVSLMILATLAVVAALFFGRVFFVPIALALLLSALLRPLVRGLENLHIPSTAGAAIVVLTLLGLLIGSGYAVAPPVKSWIVEAPATFKAAKARLAKARRSLDRVSDAAQGLGQSSSATTNAPTVPAVPPFIGDLFGTTAALIAGTAEVLLLLFLLLASGDHFLHRLVGVLPVLSDKKAAVQISREVQTAVGRYIATTLFINLGQGVIVGLALWGLGMPNPGIWGALTVVLEFIPYLGAAFMIGLLTIAALGQFPDTAHILLVPATYLVITTLQNNVVSPMAYGQRLKLNPVAVFIGVLFWWVLWGVAGAFLAVPFFATVKIICDHVEPLGPLGQFLAE